MVTPQPSRPARRGVYRWECSCQDPPVLLATYEPNGRVNIKVRDRYWHVRGQVRTICPRCGTEHALDLGDDTAPGAPRRVARR